jgi:tetratricopeptide (TPR) repeat protein
MNPVDSQPPKVRTQNIRNFTVKICDPVTRAVVGTGFVVSTDGKIVTCIHVIKDASYTHQVIQGIEVGIRFPQDFVRDKFQLAQVIACFPENDDDIVLLKVVGNDFVFPSQNIAILGVAEKSFGNPFESYGYRRLDKYLAGRAEGKILGDVEPPENCLLKVDPVQLKSSEINSGMSGAAVLDIAEGRNLVVGVVSETWFSDQFLKDRDTAWAVSASALNFPPFLLSIQDSPVPLKEGPAPKTDIEAARENVAIDLPLELSQSPSLFDEWVGREKLLNTLDADWMSLQCSLISLTGFGGEGKSSLARKWLDNFLANESLLRPDGIFWWGFYENRDVEQFFEAALRYLSADRIDPTRLKSAYIKAQVIGAMLGAGRYLFILDGLEVLQYSEGDDYGLLQNKSLRELLSYFVAGGHSSFCLVTSRLPILDFTDYITFNNRDVSHLSNSDGRNLLRKIGVKGDDSQLEDVSKIWDGHALSLSLLGTYLSEYCNGDVKHITGIPSPTAGEDHYSRAHRILCWYENHLTKEEQAFLRIFSAFRLPVSREALESSVFRQGKKLSEKLTNFRILRYKSQENTYTIHPLIREHYLKILSKDSRKSKITHLRIRDYYLSTFLKEQNRFSLNVMSLVVEIAHHFCEAGEYDEGIEVVYDLSIIGSRDNILTHFLGAYETQLELIREFFPSGDFSCEPLVSNPDNKRLILNEIGFCSEHLGLLTEAISFYERALKITVSLGDGTNSCIICDNLAGLYLSLGDFSRSEEFSLKEIDFIKSVNKYADRMTVVENKIYFEVNQKASLGWLSHLRGDIEKATTLFINAEKELKNISRGHFTHLISLSAAYHAEHLRRTKNFSHAKKIIGENIKSHKEYPDELVQGYCVLGRIANDLGNLDEALDLYDSAIKIARSTSDRGILIEALLAKGVAFAKLGESVVASSYLNEALEYVLSNGYRVYEVSIRVGLAWMHFVSGELTEAKIEAQRAKAISEEIDYYWGKIDAEEIINQIKHDPCTTDKGNCSST